MALDDSSEILDDITQNGQCPCFEGIYFDWFLSYQTDGVNWGIVDKDEIRFSFQAFPEFSPQIALSKTILLRLFCGEAELKIWRQNNHFTGRLLLDENGSIAPWNEPLEQSIILFGDRILGNSKDGFTPVANKSGSRQVVPLRCSSSDFQNGRTPLRVDIKHYFERDNVSGTIRIAVSRLVKIRKELV